MSSGLQRGSVICSWNVCLWFWLLFVVGSVSTTVAAADNKNENVCQASSGVVANDGEQVCHQQHQNNNAPNVCQTHYNQTALALEMTRVSSPKGSLSYEKLERILSQHSHFFLDLGGSQGVFDSVTENLATLLQGYGLERLQQSTHDNTNDNVLVMHTLFSNWKDETGRLYLERPNTSVILIQTEQICCSKHYGQRALLYFQLCHQSSDCMIWEYSDQNYRWLQQHQLADSVLLLPTLHQNRLDAYLPPNSNQLKPLSNRTFDVVFFGVMTDRRTKIATQLQAMAANGRWTVKIEEVPNSGSQLAYMADHYANAKICLIVHSFQKDAPGAYHRLSELATSGCVPVLETFGDTVGMDLYYQNCGGVIFSDLRHLPFAIQSVLDQLEEYDDSSLQERVQWWSHRIQWEKLLSTILLHVDNKEDRIG